MQVPVKNILRMKLQRVLRVSDNIFRGTIREVLNSHRRNMAEKLPTQYETPFNQSINQLLNQPCSDMTDRYLHPNTS